MADIDDLLNKLSAIENQLDEYEEDTPEEEPETIEGLMNQRKRGYKKHKQKQDKTEYIEDYAEINDESEPEPQQVKKATKSYRSRRKKITALKTRVQKEKAPRKPVVKEPSIEEKVIELMNQFKIKLDGKMRDVRRIKKQYGNILNSDVEPLLMFWQKEFIIMDDKIIDMLDNAYMNGIKLKGKIEDRYLKFRESSKKRVQRIRAEAIPDQE